MNIGPNSNNGRRAADGINRPRPAVERPKPPQNPDPNAAPRPETTPGATTRRGEQDFQGKLKKVIVGALTGSAEIAARPDGETNGADLRKSGENVLDGRIIGSDNRAYHPQKHGLKDIAPVVSTRPGITKTGENIVFIGGVNSDAGRDRRVLETLADKTGGAVYSLHNGTAGFLADGTEYQGDRREMDFHRSLAAKKNPYADFSSYAACEKHLTDNYSRNRATENLATLVHRERNSDKPLRLVGESQGFAIISDALSRVKARVYFESKTALTETLKKTQGRAVLTDRELRQIEQRALLNAENSLKNVRFESYGGAGNYVPTGLHSSTHFVNKHDAVANTLGPGRGDAALGTNGRIVEMDFNNGDPLVKNHAIEYYLAKRPDDRLAFAIRPLPAGTSRPAVTPQNVAALYAQYRNDPKSVIPTLEGDAARGIPRFEDWFNNLSGRELGLLYGVTDRDPRTGALTHPFQEAIGRRLRMGEKHEWIEVSRAPKAREWGITFDELRNKWALPIPGNPQIFVIRPGDPPGGTGRHHGDSTGSVAHRELEAIFDRSATFDDFKREFRKWADERVVGGFKGPNIPPALRREIEGN